MKWRVLFYRMLLEKVVHNANGRASTDCFDAKYLAPWISFCQAGSALRADIGRHASPHSADSQQLTFRLLLSLTLMLDASSLH